MRILYSLISLLLFVQTDVCAQIKQHIIKGSNCNTIYQSFHAGEGGELRSIKISTDQTGLVSIRLFDDDKTYSSADPIWEIIDIVKDRPGELVIDFDKGYGSSRILDPNKKYCFSVIGAENIHHSFLDDVYPGGNYRFEDGIERKGDLFFELALSVEERKNTEKENLVTTLLDDNKISVFPNPTLSELNVSGIVVNTEITIFDNEGKLLLKQKIQPQEKIRLDQLLDGAYYMRIKTGGEVFTKKIIKVSN